MKKLNKWFEDRNINYKKYIILFYIIFIMAPILISIALKDNGDGIMARTLSSILLLVFFVLFFVYDYRKNLAENWGLRDIVVTNDAYKTVEGEFKLSKTVKMTLSYDIEQIYELLLNSDLSGKKMEILMMNPYSEFIRLMGKEQEYADYLEKLESLAADESNDIDIKLYSLMPFDNMIIFDEDVFTFPMSKKLTDGRQLVEHYRGKKSAFARYTNSFRRIWEHPVYESNGGADEE